MRREKGREKKTVRAFPMTDDNPLTIFESKSPLVTLLAFQLASIDRE
jgi:hypothetical protein